MERFAIAVMVALMAAAAPMALGLQGSVSRGPVVEPRDPALEKEALHNLDVARQYFKKKKWTAVELRLQQVVAAHPNFSQMAEVLFLLGEAYLKTGKRELAVELYSRVVEEFPQCPFAPKARERLQALRETAQQL